MIYLGEISKIITDKHWEYFINSEGYKKIKEYYLDSTLSVQMRLIFRKLLHDDDLLKNIIIGKPEVLRNLIDLYNSEIVNKCRIFEKIEFDFYTDYVSNGGWHYIHKTINQNEAKLLSKKNSKSFSKQEIENRKNQINSRFKELEVFYGITNPESLFLKDLKRRYLQIFNRLKNNIIVWNNLLVEIFNYSKFTIKLNKWNAYKYTEKLGCNVCPYCNRNYIHTLRTEKGSTRPELDHFYPKSIYPFLSISIYNLIPSCHICNSNLKGSINFYKNKHLHPFEDTNYNKLKFKIRYKPNVSITPLLQIEDFDIVCDFVKESENDENKIVKNSVETFKIEELYNFHKDVAQEVVFNSVYYNETKRNELKSFLGDNIEIDDNFIDRVIYGNYLDENELGKRPLSKFTSDLIQSLKTE
ncbi:hypothetical protein [Faecalibacter sp. LW9]|uniref:hypothetical protein n=1 Tax=Faecalibacter sp. LW9 TaxID=3103144 RepID=UPI002AFDDAB0|nr:hypothetical protein [Faecalibacter sp. LW9]